MDPKHWLAAIPLLGRGWRYWSDNVLEAPTSSADGYGHPAIIVGDKAYCGFMLLKDGS